MIRRLPACLAAVCALALLGVVCCGPGRPAPGPWARDWSQATRLTSQIEAPGALDDLEKCESFLVRARKIRRVVTPTPDSSLDAAVEAWIEATESIAFTCPRSKGAQEEHDAAARKIRSLEAQVSAGLTTIES